MAEYRCNCVYGSTYLKIHLNYTSYFVVAYSSKNIVMATGACEGIYIVRRALSLSNCF